MSLPLLIAAGSAVVLVFVALDVWDVRTRRDAAGIAPAKWGTLGFLCAISLVFGAIQVGLTLALPKAPGILAWAEGQLMTWRGASAVEPIGWGRLALLGVLTFYVSGLFDYLAHRFLSHSRPLWWTHEYHHLPREVFVIVPGLLLRPFAAFTTVLVMVGTVAFAHGLAWAMDWPVYDLRPLVVFGAFNLLILLTSHSSFLRRGWWPHYLMRSLFLTTPHEHLLHHSVAIPCNFGNVTTLWDRVFGTYADPLAEEHQGVELGLGYDQDFLGVLTFGRWKLSPALRERFQLERYCRFDEAKERGEPEPDASPEDATERARA